MQLITHPKEITIYGYSAPVKNNNYAGTGMELCNRLWETVKSNNIKNTGINTWAYLPNDIMVTGVELLQDLPPGTGLEKHTLVFEKYFYTKHTGPYSGLFAAWQTLKEKALQMGHRPSSPGMEMYGHYDPDESKLETEIFMEVI